MDTTDLDIAHFRQTVVANVSSASPFPTAGMENRVGDHRRQAADQTAPAVQVGGAAAENHDLEKALAAVTPLVLGIVLGLGFLLLLVALQAPLAAALGVVTNLLAVGAAFGVGRLIFQD